MSRPIRDLVRALAFSAEKLPGATADAVEFVINDARDRAEMNLTGKVLNRRSGALLRTLRVDVSARNNKVSAQLQAGGRGVNYARIMRWAAPSRVSPGWSSSFLTAAGGRSAA